MGKTKLASKDRLQIKELLSWYEAHKADPFVLCAIKAYESHAGDFVGLLGAITESATSSDSEDMQTESDSLQGDDTSDALPQVQVDAARDAPYLLLQLNSGDASYMQPSSGHLPTSDASLHAQTQLQSTHASVVSASTQVPSVDTWSNLPLEGCFGLPFDVFLQLIRNALVRNIQSEAVFQNHCCCCWIRGQGESVLL